MRKPKSDRIIWAVDPFPEDAKLQLKTLQAITAVWGGGGASVEPVCVVRPTLSVAGEAGNRLTIETALRGRIGRDAEPALLPLTILVQEQHSLSNSVETLLRHAQRTRASVIAVSTHARTRLLRLALGSFAETLLLRSEIPTLVVNPDASSGRARPLRRLLFPTDFSEGSRRAFREVLPLARRRAARVTLFYQFEYLAPGTADQIHGSAAHQRFFERDLAARRATAESWAKTATRAGVPVDVVLSQEPGFVPDAVLAMAAKSKAGLIAMASQSGAVAATLLGSVVRRIVREAPCPVWVIHPAGRPAS